MITIQRPQTLRLGKHYQWRSQKLCLRGADPRVEAPKAPSWMRSGEGCPLHSRLGSMGSVVSFPSGVRSKAPAANACSGYSRPQNASRRKIIKSFSVQFSSMNYWSNNNCVAVQSYGDNCPYCPPWLRNWLHAVVRFVDTLLQSRKRALDPKCYFNRQKLHPPTDYWR